MAVEYMNLEKKLPNKNILIQELNLLGKDGWMVVNITETAPPKYGEDWKFSVLLSKETKKEDTRQIL